MTFKSPIIEQRFVLDHIARIGEMAENERYAAADSEMVDAILEGAGALADEIWAPLNRKGDTSLPVWDDGNVSTADGFKDAFNAYVEGGGVRLPFLPNLAGRAFPSCWVSPSRNVWAVRIWH